MGHRCLGCGLSLGFLFLAAGCGEKRFGETWLAPSAPPAAMEMKLPLRLTGASGFNIYHRRRYTAGAAEAEGKASSDGAARAQIALTGGGAGWVEFEVGQGFPADALPAGDVTARILVSYRYQVNVPAAYAPKGFLALKTVVINSRRQIVKRHVLRDVNVTEAAQSWSGRDEAFLTFTVEPDTAYQVLLAGRLELDSMDRPCEADIGLTVESVELELTAAN